MKHLNKYILVFFAFIISQGCKSTTSAQVLGKTTTNSQTLDSSCLITIESFSENWEWKFAVFNCNQRATADKTGQEIKVATSKLDGVYNNQYNFHVSSTLHEYPSEINWEVTFFTPATITHSNKPIFDLNYLNIGKSIEYDCVIDKELNSVADCKIQAVFEKHVYIMEATSNPAPSKSDMETIFNPILSSVNACINSLENRDNK